MTWLWITLAFIGGGLAVFAFFAWLLTVGFRNI